MISNRAVTAATLGLVLWLCGLAAMLAFGTFPAAPHEATPTAAMPLGWQYGWECCSFTDCRQISEGAVSETPQGYVIKLTGEVIPYGDKRLKQSKDEFYHQCTKGGDPKAPKSICLYTPDRGF
ncbi:hypothetical protein NKJ93_02230 [Mesorhizobium sp. M0028]|uniref:hypothetical protein n=1 Tax=Mesorhizobium sp. M0028 TaxID=2956849 RepID=UPI003337D3F8